MPGIEISPHLPEHVKQLVKYIPENEILASIEKMLETVSRERKEAEPAVRPDTRVVAVYSPAGGCGKSLAAVALARKMQRLDVPVLLIGCDSMQSFSVYLDQEEYADEILAARLQEPEEDTYWNILQNIKRGPLTCLLPFEKPLYGMGIGLREIETLLSILKERQDFACIILDLGSEFSEKNQRLMEEADVRLLITQSSRAAARKMKKLQQNRNLLPGGETLMICNQYGTDHSSMSEKPGRKCFRLIRTGRPPWKIRYSTGSRCRSWASFLPVFLQEPPGQPERTGEARTVPEGR